MSDTIQIPASVFDDVMAKAAQQAFEANALISSRNAGCLCGYHEASASRQFKSLAARHGLQSYDFGERSVRYKMQDVLDLIEKLKT